MRLARKAVLLTGAATGIGRACALRFAREGARLLLADVLAAEGESLAREVRGVGGEAVFLMTDVSVRADNERAVDACVERFGAIDVLVCNAGITLPKRLPDSSDEDIARLLAVNLHGPLFAARRAIPAMLGQPDGGVILFTAS